ncbi:hypothetical protein [Nocardia nova]|uniref:hypothetical protein n=1 Tax=Nocardia nova TaxID=37330 RepID=UPI0033ED982A
MKFLNNRPRPPRHPAVIDTFGADPASTPRRHNEAHARSHARRPGMKTAAALTAIVSIALTVWAVQQPQAHHPAADPVTTAHPPTSAGTTEPDECRADPGDQDSGEGVVKAFEFAYYVTRSADQARKLAAPTSSVQAADALQAVINDLPPGTTYCLHTTAIAADVYLVVLSERRPGQQVQQWTQTVTTKQLDGRWYVDVFK